MNRKLKFAGTVFAMSLSLLGRANATSITGTVDTTGTAGVSASIIDFYNNPATSCSSGPNIGTPGCFLTGSGTGSFAGLNGTVGTVKDLTGPQIVGNVAIPAFMVFSNGITFDITSIPDAGQPACASVDPTQGGVTCVPRTAGPSPFRLTNGPNGPNGVANTVGIQFVVNLVGYTGTAASGSTPYVGIFTTQIAGMNAADVLNALAANNGTGFVVHSYSASFFPVAGVPEPGSMALLGVALIGFPMLARRMKRS